MQRDWTPIFAYVTLSVNLFQTSLVLLILWIKSSVKISRKRMKILPTNRKLQLKLCKSDWYHLQSYRCIESKADASLILMLATSKSVPSYFKNSRSDRLYQLHIGKDLLHKPNAPAMRPSANVLPSYGPIWFYFLTRKEVDLHSVSTALPFHGC